MDGQIDPPLVVPAGPSVAGPCPTCGSPFEWEDHEGQRHCSDCERAPSLAMVVKAWVLIKEGGPGGAGQLAWLDDTDKLLPLWRECRR